jgi:hypothetical protein
VDKGDIGEELLGSSLARFCVNTMSIINDEIKR